LAQEGVVALVSGRAKDVDSLIKKLLLKKNLSYDQLSDRAGLRVIVRFRSEICAVDRLIEANYRLVKRDDKTEQLDPDKFNYQGLHLDVELKSGVGSRTFRGYKAEIQVRTKAQNLWSEMAHELLYKGPVPLTKKLQRRLFSLVALLEMADEQLETVEDAMLSLPNAEILRVLQILEKGFLRFNPVPYSRELSIHAIGAMVPIYEKTVRKWDQHFQEFVQRNAKKLKVVFTEAKGRSVFLTQPEVLMIFDLLDVDEDRLQQAWNQTFPSPELEELARIWGRPLD